jgi:uncharacterized protein involved in type VI secretion and phage assembly
MSLYEMLKEPGTASAGGRVSGVLVGIVTNNKDPDGLGRVKVRFPSRDSNDESFWARQVSLMAGGNRGTYFLPEVDDEVLVAFENGDIEHPYIIGALWNGKDKPPQSNSDGKNNVRAIRSRSGHEILFNDDSQGKQEKLVIKTNSGHTITLDDASGQEKIEIKDKSGSNSIVINSMEKSITIKSDMKLSFKSQMIEIEAQGMMTIKSSGTLTLQGTLVQIN